MNLLRESNSQLREENKHNFEECQVDAFSFLHPVTTSIVTSCANLSCGCGLLEII